MHQGPGRPAAQSVLIAAAQELVALAGVLSVEQQRVEPIIAAGEGGLVDEGNPGNTGERAAVARRELALSSEESVELLELRATERRVEIRHAVIEGHGIMDEGPGVRQLRRGGEVLRPLREIRIVGGDGATAAGGDDLVAVEAESGEPREAAGGPPLVAAAEGFRRILDDREAELAGEGIERLHIDGMTEGVHRHDRGDASPDRKS